MKSTPTKKAVAFILNAAVYYAIYLAFTANVGFRELVTGLAVASISAIATLIFSSAAKVRFRFRLRDIIQAWRMPWYVIDDTIKVLRALGKELLVRRGAPSFFAAVPYDVGKQKYAIDAGRRAIEITYSTATPNLIVIGILEEQEILLYHQLIPDEISAMSRNLGVRA